MISIFAKEYLDPLGSIAKSAELLADAVVEHLQRHEDVLVHLEGIKGMPTSYYNIILLAVRDRMGLTAIGTRLSFQFGTAAQETTFKVSLHAVQKEGVDQPHPGPA